MPTYYVRPAGGGPYGNADGTTYVDAWAGYAGITGIAAGDTIYICGGTHSEVFLLGTAGTSGSPIVYRGDASSVDSSYDDGVLDGGDSVNFAFDMQVGRDYVTVSNFTIRDFAKAAFRCINTAVNAANGLIIENLVISGCGQDSIAITTTAPVPAPCDFIIRNITITDTNWAGVYVNTAIASGLIEDVTVDGWGADDSSNRWGIYTSAKMIDADSGWSNTGGDIWEIADANTAVSVQSASATTTYDYPLRNAGATASPSAGEFGQTGGNIYVNIGQEPNGKVTSISYATTKNVNINNCSVKNWNGSTADGVGIGFDQHVQDSIIYSCLSESNDDGFSLNKNINCLCIGNIAANNLTSGFRHFRGRDCTIINNTAYNNTGAQYVLEDVQDTIGTTTLANNIAYGGTDGASLTVVTQLTEDYNLAYGYSSAVGFAGANTITSDPLLTSGYLPTTDSPAIGAGTFVSFNGRDYTGNKFRVLPTIGAYEANIPDQYLMIDYEEGPVVAAAASAPNLITNGTFDADSDWVKGAGWTIGSDVATHATGSTSNLTQNFGAINGETYRVTVDVVETSAPGTYSLSSYVNGCNSGIAEEIGTTGTHQYDMTCCGTDETIYFQAGANWEGTIDNVTVILL